MNSRLYVRIFLFTIQLLLVFLLLVYWLPFASRLDFFGRDLATRLRLHYTEPPEAIKKIVLVELDDETLRVSGQRFPFPRWLHAQAIDGFMSVNPLAVAYDFVFGGVGYTPEEDETLKQSLSRAHGVVLASYIGDDFKEQAPNKEFLNEHVVKAPINKFVGVHGDQKARTALPFFISKETEEKQWSWEFATLFQAGIVKPEDVTLQSNTWGRTPKDAKGFSVPVSNWQMYDINYLADGDDFPKIPFWRFVAREFVGDPDFSDKIFLVGHTSKLSHDKHETPIGEMQGLHLNACTLLTLLSGRFLYYVPMYYEWALLALGLLLVLWAGLTRRTVLMTVLAALSLISYIAISIFSLWHDVIFDLYAEAFYLLLVWFGMAVYRQLRTAVENISLREEAIHDPLTGFFTRRYFQVRLKYDLEKLGNPSFAAKRTGSPGEFALAMVDLDNFKLVNDTFGHAEGDRTLKTVAEVLRKYARREDILCRFGGDEFCIIMSGTNAEGGAALLERVRQGLLDDDRLCYTTKGNVKSIRVTASFGVASAKWRPDMTEEVLIKVADKALYEAKRAGRNRIVIADESLYFQEGTTPTELGKYNSKLKEAEKRSETKPTDHDSAA